MAQYGQTNPTDEEVQGIVARVLSNQDEVKIIRSSGSGEIVKLFKEKQIQQLKKLLMTNLLLSYGE
jgi:trigger factor